MRDGHVAGTTWQVADVKRPLMSVAKMVAAGNRVHLDSKDPRIVRPKGDVIPLRKAGNVFVVDLWVRKRCNRQKTGFSPAGLSPEVCPTDDGLTIKPMRNEGAARERNVVGFDLGGVEDSQEECKVGPHAEEEPNMDCESDGGEDGERVRLLPKPRTPSKAEWERHVVSHMPFRDWCRHCVAGRGLERRHQRHPGHDDQYPLVCIDYGYLSGDATPMLVAKDRRTGMAFALPVERKGAADPHAVEQLAAWGGHAGIVTGGHTQRWRAGCDAGCRCSETQEKQDPQPPWRHLRQVIMLEMVWPKESSGNGGWHGQDTQE